MQSKNQSLGETTLALYSLGVACLALSAVKALAWGWFPFFRFYGPEKPLFNKTWKLPDIELVK